jgi:hypothetical protein
MHYLNFFKKLGIFKIYLDKVRKIANFKLQMEV